MRHNGGSGNINVHLKASPMSAHDAPASSAVSTEAQTRDLAAQIYVELVGRVMLTAQQTKPNPVDLAKFAYKLAEAFQSIEVEAHKEAVAKMAKYDVKVDDITSWKK
jgi:hypothetical protein